MFYNEKSINKVRSMKWCSRCCCDLQGKPAISVYDGYESSFYFCEKCEDYFKKTE